MLAEACIYVYFRHYINSQLIFEMTFSIFVVVNRFVRTRRSGFGPFSDYYNHFT